MATCDVPAPSIVLKSKICLVGEQAVGKTSLIHRFVSGVFDDSYIRTLGAVVSKKAVEFDSVGGRPVHVDMSILDIMGKRMFLDLFRESYFHGASGVLGVADLTRRSTLDALPLWIENVEDASGKLPVVIVVNKADLSGHAEYGMEEILEVAGAFGAESLLGSAKTGDHVEDAFRRLAFLAASRQLTSPAAARHGKAAIPLQGQGIGPHAL